MQPLNVLPVYASAHIVFFRLNASVTSGLDPGTHLLQKPFGIEQLAVKVRRVLDSNQIARAVFGANGRIEGLQHLTSKSCPSLLKAVMSHW